MDSFTKPARFIYNPESEDAFSGILQIHVHHARNIHNICIYDNQDVYAKFSLTYNPDETFSTQVINGGGKNPEFNEDLIMKINQIDAVLKCEIWMLSRAKHYMDDQLLGFALVPISSLSGKEKVTEDYDLSSTDLFHSPAGTIKLSLSLNAKTALNDPLSSVVDDSSAISELLLDKKMTQDYSRIEFPDINVVNENQQMVSEYFAKNGTLLTPWLGKPDGSFLHLGAGPHVPPVEDYEMAGNSSDDYPADSVSPDGSVQNSGFLSSTMTSLSDDRNSADSMEKKGPVFADFSTSPNENASSSVIGEGSSKNKDDLHGENEMKKESEMQQHIVDMYMRSMQQFTESLAKMKLPMDLDRPQGDVDEGDVKKKKNDNSRVFYGSRAFF